MAPAKTDKAVVGDVFFTGPEGYGEHLQIAASDPIEYFELRAQAVEVLKKAGATARWQDEKREYTKPSPMEQAAAATFPGVTQDIPASIPCPVDGKAMKLVPQGKFGPFYACDMRAGGCGKNVNE